MSDQNALYETAESLAVNGLDLEAIAASLQVQFPNRPHEYRIAAMHGLAKLKSEAQRYGTPGDASEPVEPETPATASDKPKKKKSDKQSKLPTIKKYNWQPSKNVALPSDARRDRTLIPADLASMPFVFNGATDPVFTLAWGTVRIHGRLTPFDFNVVVAIFQEIQEYGPRVANNCFACPTSHARLHRRIYRTGKYGGSGLRRIKQSLERLRRTIINVKDQHGEHHLRVLESYEAISAPSGQRLLIRVGSTLSDRMYQKGGVKGAKPVELEPWQDLRGRAAIAYMMADNLMHLHGEAVYKYDTLVERLNLQGSRLRNIAKINQLTERLNNRLCSYRDKTNLQQRYRMRITFDGRQLRASPYADAPTALAA